MITRLDNDQIFSDKIFFSHEATSRESGQLNRHNVRTWSSDNPHETRELERSSPKVNVRCEIICNQINGPFLY